MVPVAMLLSALFTTARLSAFNELAAMKSGGMSLYRLMAPLLVFALLVSAASIYFNGWVVPYANKKKFEIARVYFQKNIQFVSKSNIFIQDSPTRILSISSYDDQRNVARGVSIQDFDPADPTIMTGRYDATLMLWNEPSQSWSLSKGMQRRFSGTTESVKSFEGLYIGKLHFTPEEIRKKQLRPEEMDYNDLHDFIEAQERAGQDVARWLVDFYGKMAFPFASFIVVLFGVPFSSIKRRSGLGVEVGIAVAICFAYMIFLKVSQAFGYNGDLNPLLTAWLANILFLAGGIATLMRVPK
jgi:lipopolysaccharide export system permease protein